MIGLDVKLERVLAQALTTSGGLEPGLADTLLRETHAALERQESQGNAPVLLVSPVLRARFVALPAAPPAAAGRFVEYGNTG